MANITTRSKKIKMVATDIDGVWTDAKMYYTQDGDHMKAFSTYDGFAVQLLKEQDIRVVIMTGENSPMVARRAEKLGIEHVYLAESEKLKRLNYLCTRYEIDLDEVAYIGDDLNDIEVLKAVGISGMPPNSPILDKVSPHIITKRAGGDGAFREFVDMILSHR
jgi:YrbI family 3-deoxy-D-manno-octulosonate 8-phosphate phosphatase